jgi:hypothetical protein
MNMLADRCKVALAAAMVTMTTRDIADRIRSEPDYLEPLLCELEDAGVIEWDHGWKLSAWTEARLGRALRDLKRDDDD